MVTDEDKQEQIETAPPNFSAMLMRITSFRNSRVTIFGSAYPLVLNIFLEEQAVDGIVLDENGFRSSMKE
ncbi:Photosystem II protein D1 [Frankliniella fusca]|uniref:Photosystem II protein D1 n=1 Tax=Frankliniella fusca TaxID=407009 RepID=A0AAE1GVW4_9NEOP|nr:Photosystem II protein D1 [Frankliniella fusca]